MGNYESTRFDIQANLEDWEDTEQSMQVLREKLVSIAGVELSNGYNNLLGKINLERKYIKEIRTVTREIEAKESELEELKTKLKAVESLCSDSKELLKTYDEFKYKDSTLKELSNIIYSYNVLCHQIKEVNPKNETSSETSSETSPEF
ncbi:hypothetical protein [Limnoraphis robusta]|nr:hypothetical protein [Limnoraphis robusta]